MCVLRLNIDKLLWSNFHHFIPHATISHSMFKPDASKPPKPLDAILGFTNGGACDLSNEPTVKIYMQRHPIKANQYIPLIVLQDHLSDEFIRSTLTGVDELKMHGNPSSGKFTRFSSIQRDDDGPIPVVTFGNSEPHRRLYRAHPMATCEIQGSQIASHTLLNVDKTYRSVLSQLQLIIKQRSEQPMSSDTLEDVNITDTLEDISNTGSKHAATFTWPLVDEESGKGEIIDRQDSAVTSLSNGGVFSPHSDGENKRCNNDPRCPATHVDHMRVFTNSIVPGYTEGDKMITMRHGLPGKDKSKCDIIGYLDCKGFSPWKEKPNKAIPISGKSSAHIQPHGAQSDLHHFPESKIKTLRLVWSFRSTHRCQVTVNQQKDDIIKNYRVLECNQSGQSDGVVSLISGKDPWATPINKKQQLSSVALSCQKEMKETMHTRKKKKVRLKFYSTHKNGPIEKCEMSTQDKLSGLDNVSVEMIATSLAAAKSLYQHSATLLLDVGKGRKRTVGPYPVKVREGEYRLLRTGESMLSSELNAASNIKTSKLQKNIINTDSLDTISLKRFSKNDPEMLRVTRIAHVGGKLNGFSIRGRGGADQIAGSYAVDITNKRCVKGASNHLVSTSQKVDDPYHKAMLSMVQNNRVVNVFCPDENNSDYAVYIGTYCVMSIEIKAKTKEEVAREKEELRSLLDGKLSKQMESEMNAMHNPTMYIKLEPLDENFNTHFASEETKSWNVVEATLKDILQPKSVYIGDPPVGSWQDRLGHNLPFLTEKIKSRYSLGSGGNNDIDNVDFGDKFADNIGASGRRQFTREQFLNGMFYSSLFAMARTVGPCVTRDGEMKIIPPSFVFDQLIEDGVYEDRKNAYEKTHLSSIVSRAIHPATVCQDIVGLLAMYVTNSYQAKLRETENGNYCHRFGRGYILNSESENEAWNIIFQAVICCIVYPSALIQIRSNFNGSLVPLPGQLQEFVESVNRFEWNRGNGFIHEIFQSCFRRENSDDLFTFFVKFGKEGKDLIQGAVGSCRDEREKILERIKSGLLECGLECEDFQMQVIARTIEVCLHEPFGPVRVVHGGSGGTIAANCFIDEFKKEDPSQGTTDKDARKVIFGWLIGKYNDRARGIMIAANLDDERMIKNELAVLGLEWSCDLQCIIHSLGIGKKWDSSDLEHGGCGFQRLVKNNRPANNMSKEILLDSSARFGPVRVGPGCKTLASEMDIFEHPKILFESKILPAFWELQRMEPETYPNNTLHEVLRIQFDRKTPGNAGEPDLEYQSQPMKLTPVLCNITDRAIKLNGTIQLISGFVGLFQTGVKEKVSIGAKLVTNYEQLCGYTTGAVLRKVADLEEAGIMKKNECKYCVLHTDTETLYTPLKTDKNNVLLLGLQGYNEVYVGCKDSSTDLKFVDGTGVLWVKNRHGVWVPENGKDPHRLLVNNLAKGSVARFVIAPGDALLIPTKHFHAIVTPRGANLLMIKMA